MQYRGQGAVLPHLCCSPAHPPLPWSAGPRTRPRPAAEWPAGYGLGRVRGFVFALSGWRSAAVRVAGSAAVSSPHSCACSPSYLIHGMDLQVAQHDLGHALAVAVRVNADLLLDHLVRSHVRLERIAHALSASGLRWMDSVQHVLPQPALAALSGRAGAAADQARPGEAPSSPSHISIAPSAASSPSPLC